MKTVSIISQKGGSGKTTLALNLLVAAYQQGISAVLVDIDPHANAWKIYERRESEEPVVISAVPARLREIKAEAEKLGADLLIIDTAAASESPALEAARIADLVLVPCRSSILDLDAISFSFDLASLAKTDAVAVINACPPVGALGEEAAEAISSLGLEGSCDCAPIRIAHRADFYHSLSNSQGVCEYNPAGKAAEEIKEFFAWMCMRVGMYTGMDSEENQTVSEIENDAVTL